MYCKKCGKLLESDARYCSHCGEKVSEEIYDNSLTDEEKPEKKSFHIDSFNWNLEGYPSDKPQKTEDVDFNWESVLEEKKERRNAVEEVKPTAREAAEENIKSNEEVEVPKSNELSEINESPVTDESPENNGLFETDESRENNGMFESNESQENNGMFESNESQENNELFESNESLENNESSESSEPSETASLEEKIFGAKNYAFISEEPTKIAKRNANSIDKFYTFSKKNEEFQQLLDKEYEKIQDEKSTEELLEKEELPQPPVIEEIHLTPEEEKDNFVKISWTQTPLEVMACDMEKRYHIVDMASGESRYMEDGSKGNQHKLTFDDVFNGNDEGDDEDEEDEKPRKKKGGFLKTVAIFLCILAIAELIMFGILTFAKDSFLAEKINDGYLYIVEKIKGDNSEATPKVEKENVSEIMKIINKYKDQNSNIGSITENKDLLFDDSKDYNIDKIGDSYTFTNSTWYTDANGNDVYYGDEIVKTVIKYYSAWVDKANGENDDILNYIDDTSELYREMSAFSGETGVTYGIDKLEIGEIRAGNSEFYILVSISKVNSKSTEESVETNLIYMKPEDEKQVMKILDIKKI